MQPLDLAGRIQAVLNASPEARLSNRRLRVLSHAEAVDKNTWQRALTKALEGNPQWKRIASSLERAA